LFHPPLPSPVKGEGNHKNFLGCSKMARCKAPEIPRTEAYWGVRRRDEG
jgi:hypothetical protein